MQNENQETINEIHALYDEASVELLETYGLTAESAEQAPVESRLCSVLSVTGEGIRLVSILQPEIELLKNLYPGDRDNLSQQDIEDWCGEINNQLAGRIKNKLLDRGCEVMLGLPSLVVGKDIEAVQPKDASVRQTTFFTSGGRIAVLGVARIDPEFMLMPVGAAQSAGVMREGEISLF